MAKKLEPHPSRWQCIKCNFEMFQPPGTVFRHCPICGEDQKKNENGTPRCTECGSVFETPDQRLHHKCYHGQKSSQGVKREVEPAKSTGNGGPAKKKLPAQGGSGQPPKQKDSRQPSPQKVSQKGPPPQSMKSAGTTAPEETGSRDQASHSNQLHQNKGKKQPPDHSSGAKSGQLQDTVHHPLTSSHHKLGSNVTPEQKQSKVEPGAAGHGQTKKVIDYTKGR